MQMIDPIDRSMPPAMMTTASPSANSEMSEMWRRLLRRLSPPRKSGFKSAVMTASAIITESIVISFFAAWTFIGPSGGGRAQDVGVGEVAARELAARAPLGQHEGPVAQGRDLLGLGAGDDDPLAGGGQLAD